MDRRTFAKSMGLLATFPLLPVRFVKPGVSLELVREFSCKPWDPSSRFPALSSPFIQDKSANASDGRVGIRLRDTLGLADTSAEEKMPPLNGAFDEHWLPDQTWRPWPQADYFTSRYGCCPLCRGMGWIGDNVDYCAYCDEGSVRNWDEFESLEVFKCDHCDGKGVMPNGAVRCTCYGKQVPTTQELDGRYITGYYHRIISKLPDVHFVRSNDPDQCVMFRFEGGQGLLMPISHVERIS